MDTIISTPSTPSPDPLDSKGHLSRTQLYFVVAILSLIILGLSSFLAWTYLVPEETGNNNEGTDSGNTEDNDTEDASDQDTTDNQDSAEDDDNAGTADSNTDTEWLTYESVERSIRFNYPPTWTLAEEDLEDTEYTVNRHVVTVTSLQGSIFKHSSAEFLVGFGIESECDPSDPTGTNPSGNVLNCTFVTDGQIPFARYASDNGWLITEHFNGSTSYTVNPQSQFSYENVITSDLSGLDEIMKTVERL
jgi:hypothetical protein